MFIQIAGGGPSIEGFFYANMDEDTPWTLTAAKNHNNCV